MFLSSIPMTIFNLYFGFFDSTCVNNHAKPLIINLKHYFIVDGLFSISIPFLLFFISIIAHKICYNHNNVEKILSPLIGPFYAFFAFLIFLFFKIIWSIIAGFIFWKYMDNTTCSYTLFNYLFSSLIIKYIFYFFSLIFTNFFNIRDIIFD